MDIPATICAVTGAARATRAARIQQLWGGWGEIVRYRLDGAAQPSVIVKVVQPPGRLRRGDRSAARKRRSYQVEAAFYQGHAAQCAARVPAPLHISPGLFVLEDLDAAGFSGRSGGAAACVDWLADFHAGFLGRAPAGLWPVGTYWHLETRPDELQSMPRGPLRDAAVALDARLAGARAQTLLHGDAKRANFCFGPHSVAAVDFQYVGGGCGVRDLAYLLGSLLSDAELFRAADPLADRYFARLRAGLPADADGAAVEAEWRALLPVAWADFERFLAGWAPGHRSGPYAAAQTRAALRAL